MSYLDEICNNYIVFEKELDDSKNLDEFAKHVKDKYSLITKHLAEDMGVDYDKLRAMTSYGKLDRFFEIVGDYDVLNNTTKSKTFRLPFEEVLGIEKYVSFNRLFDGLLFISSDFAYLDLSDNKVNTKLNSLDFSVIENMRKSFLEKYLN
ncbi:hypothetical protein HOE22_02965 [Candidatus Woesearchaeota archaeon]|jgi:hypothetical protein|nr:hypothetical protein [Candidatus Woesearchaeota archaeon]MBT3438599.1 hypothetical protein [Candidatus Woesearchaeota archaeon]MBT4207284.1 hypothetical protein [Candidatus Woesearchaeota archaeon]MBT4733194.1 hypothetical protein [Candidatus Woesearchaeota archaeon]MBT5042712.1 hypothetical protein [Candidatus Woesearchaeota archaeon]